MGNLQDIVSGSNAPSSRTVLPDPTQHLHWSDFPGAIHDIFHKNALTHPDRQCVVETAGRSFTYRQIDEASNILAHHLVQAGVQRDEVVMVYAYRGVDLVVAVMGVLKAGATFSVIDPAYPPDRQNIYLDVSRPRALVVIKKASLEEGEMSDTVRSFISNTLHLRTDVPALEIRDDGSLTGGLVDGVDILAAQSSLKSAPPGILVGPDSTPTLSFTSGSEGRPKGVKGRHFSLAYYFPWMAERFGLSERDSFTMLSGIAHDPIQRDIFTPLFLGARLLVPSKDDIQHERLAEWMQQYGATVTHLTPAMGQILVGGASAEFTALHHAFFVGDILIKRDCRSLQRLAPNVNIVNMYGTTETQRAVSFYEIPSRSKDNKYLDRMKDVIPAGKGMLNVQLLVVDRADRSRICPVGEAGELYVRAAGLAEGYLGLPDLTTQKFLPNWFLDPNKWAKEDETKAAESKEPWREFYLGPRDRLYRTGDLGRYMPSGDVECCGRVDDQVKIRGFRIELGEIDTHLSQHPLIRENVTLVRRDKDEEPTLVSYFVPENSRWPEWLRSKGLKEETQGDDMTGMLRRYRALRDDARDHLKKKLPAYAVPTVFVPLHKMPLNPNGKIDKPALPFPDNAELSAASLRRSSFSLGPLNETEKALASIWASLLPHVSVRMISPDDSFFDLGGHSILAQQMLSELRKGWKDARISMTAIFSNPTLGGLAAKINKTSSTTSTATEQGQNMQQGAKDGADLAYDASDDYAADAHELARGLARRFPTSVELDRTKPLTVFLTGATGFLGAFILRDLLNRSSPKVNVIALVRARTSKEAFERVQRTCQAYGIWSPDWSSRLKCLMGNLVDPLLGLPNEHWDLLTEEVDVVIHNGAKVHWVSPYSHLKSHNVLGTISALQLCSTGKAKKFTFVSSTSVLDTKHYIEESMKAVGGGGKGILEADDLQGSAHGLGTGYGQSKWVAEFLVKEAGKRGLSGTIVRPGYVLGDSKSGVTNTDDFLVRMIKGCMQLHSRPNIRNTINMVPVDHVARAVVASTFSPPVQPLGLAQITSNKRLSFAEYLAAVQAYGYDLPEVDYPTWRQSLEQWSSTPDHEEHALMPLYHFVTGDLPADTRAPELDDTNTRIALQKDAQWTGEDVSSGSGVTPEILGLYLAYLVAVGFLPAPPGGQGMTPLPKITISDEQRAALAAFEGRK